MSSSASSSSLSSSPPSHSTDEKTIGDEKPIGAEATIGDEKPKKTTSFKARAKAGNFVLVRMWPGGPQNHNTEQVSLEIVEDGVSTYYISLYKGAQDPALLTVFLPVFIKDYTTDLTQNQGNHTTDLLYVLFSLDVNMIKARGAQLETALRYHENGDLHQANCFSAASLVVELLRVGEIQDLLDRTEPLYSSLTWPFFARGGLLISAGMSSATVFLYSTPLAAASALVARFGALSALETTAKWLRPHEVLNLEAELAKFSAEKIHGLETMVDGPYQDSVYGHRAISLPVMAYLDIFHPYYRLYPISFRLVKDLLEKAVAKETATLNR